MTRKQRRDLAGFESSCHLPTCLHHTRWRLHTRGRQPAARGPDEALQGILPGRRPFTVIRPSTFFSFFNDRYAAINRRNDIHLRAKTFFMVFATHSSEKDLFLVFAMNSAEKRPEVPAKTFLFWSAGMVAARWNLVRTECGLQVQKVADPCFTLSCLMLNVKQASCEYQGFSVFGLARQGTEAMVFRFSSSRSTQSLCPI